MSTRKNLVLDLDQTLISSQETDKYDVKKNKEKCKQFKYHHMDDSYVVFERPHIQEFLDYVFEHYTVSVWTAACVEYGVFVIKNVILKDHPERHLDYAMFLPHVEASRDYTKDKTSKALSMLWDVYKLPNYTKENTLILDDCKEEVHTHQTENCVIAKPFEYKDDDSDKDEFLKHAKELLKKIKEDDDVKNGVLEFNNTKRTPKRVTFSTESTTPSKSPSVPVLVSAE